MSGAAAASGDAVPRPLLRAVDLHKTYGEGPAAARALAGVDLEVPAGRLLAVRGRSGSGKTTLLNVCGGLERPDRGEVTLDVPGRGPLRLSHATESELLRLRRDEVSYVFQAFGLLPMLSAAENVGVPLRLTGTPVAEREERVAGLLDLVGLAGHAHQHPDELSGGQQQRVAVARALATRPRLLVADEPTGQLDTATGAQVMRLLRDLVDRQGVAVLVATHEPGLAELADETVVLEDGRRT